MKFNSSCPFSVGPGIFIVAASYAGCDRGLVVALFTIAMGIMGTFYPGMKVNSLDLSPNYAGSLMALTNGIGAITGIVAPYVVGLMTPEVSGQGPGQSLDKMVIPFLPFSPPSEYSWPVAHGLLGGLCRLHGHHRCILVVGLWRDAALERAPFDGQGQCRERRL